MVQFIPILMAPQIFLSGIIVDVEEMPAVLEGLARVLPLTYAVDALKEIMVQGKGLGEAAPELGVLAAYGAALLTAALTTVRRV